MDDIYTIDQVKEKTNKYMKSLNLPLLRYDFDSVETAAVMNVIRQQGVVEIYCSGQGSSLEQW